MKREEAINKLLQQVTKQMLAKVVAVKSGEEPYNYTLQLLNMVFHSANDPQKNWFTALGVLCINQRYFCSNILQKAHTSGGKPPMSSMTKKELIDAIASGSKLTKADAG